MSMADRYYNSTRLTLTMKSDCHVGRCPAVISTLVSSTMSRTTVAGGVPQSSMRLALTAGTWASTTAACTGTTTTRTMDFPYGV